MFERRGLNKKGAVERDYTIWIILGGVFLAFILIGYFLINSQINSTFQSIKPEDLELTIQRCHGIERAGVSFINTFCNDFKKVSTKGPDQWANCEHAQVQSALRQIRAEEEYDQLKCERGPNTSPEKTFCQKESIEDNNVLVNNINCETWLRAAEEQKGPTNFNLASTDNGDATYTIRVDLEPDEATTLIFTLTNAVRTGINYGETTIELKTDGGGRVAFDITEAIRSPANEEIKVAVVFKDDNGKSDILTIGPTSTTN